MPTYIVLHKLTDQGIKNIKDAPQRIEEGIKAFQEKRTPDFQGE